MANTGKKAKPSALLYLLIVLVVLICIVAAIILFLTVFRTAGDGPDRPVNGSNLPIFLEPKPTTTSTSTATSTGTSSSRSDGTTSDGTTDMSTTLSTLLTTLATTLSTAGTTTSTPEDLFEITLPVNIDSLLVDSARYNEVIQKCSAISAQPVVCRPSNEAIQKLNESDFQPLHYSLNITVRNVQQPYFESDVSIFVNALQPGNQISLNAGRLRNLDQVSIVNCDTGETLCVARNVHDATEGTLTLLVEKSFDQDTQLRVDFRKVVAAESAAHVYKQVPNWNREMPTFVGSLFGANSARQLFPAFDHPLHKATVTFCMNHPPVFSARSNADALLPTISGQSCFAKSVPITAQQLAFVAFDRAEIMFYNKTTVDGAYVPDVEIVFSVIIKNFKREKNEWIYNETSQVISLLSRWTGFSYPLNKLVLVSSNIPPPGHSALGIITLPGALVEHPSYTTTHVSLVKEIIGQWLEGVVTTVGSEDNCFEKALTTYLEWKVNERLQLVKKTRKGEIGNIRPLDLKSESKNPRILRNPQIPGGKCEVRFVEVFYAFDETFGSGTVIGMIREILNKFAFKTATLADWQAAAVSATGRAEAGTMLEEWFSRKSRPVLRATVRQNSVEFEQLATPIWAVPLEVTGSTGTQLALIADQKQSVPFTSIDYVVVDPKRKSPAFVVYDVDTYERLMHCFDDKSRCPSTEVGGALTDLGAVLVADLLPAPDVQEIPKWKALFTFMIRKGLVSGDAACCVQHAVGQMSDAQCTWVINDTCGLLTFSQTLVSAA